MVFTAVFNKDMDTPTDAAAAVNAGKDNKTALTLPMSEDRGF